MELKLEETRRRMTESYTLRLGADERLAASAASHRLGVPLAEFVRAAVRAATLQVLTDPVSSAPTPVGGGVQ